MSIRLLARDLYRSQQEIDRLEDEIKAVSWEQKNRLEADLRLAVARREKLRRMLDGRLDR